MWKEGKNDGKKKEDSVDIIPIGLIHEKQHNLMIHYSNKIFAARVTTITFIVLAGGFALSIIDLDPKKPTEWTNLWVSVLVTTLWMLEMGYFKKFNIIVIALGKLESEGSPYTFFTEYNPFTHRMIYVFYFCTSCGLLLHSNLDGLSKLPAFLFILFPIVQMLYVADLWVAHREAKKAGKGNKVTFMKRVLAFVKRIGYCASYVAFGSLIWQKSWERWVPLMIMVMIAISIVILIAIR